jgi:hypothetical protein
VRVKRMEIMWLVQLKVLMKGGSLWTAPLRDYWKVGSRVHLILMEFAKEILILSVQLKVSMKGKSLWTAPLRDYRKVGLMAFAKEEMILAVQLKVSMKGEN